MIPTAVLAAQYAGVLDYSETTRIDARATQPLPQLALPPREIALASDATFAPTALLRLGDRRWDYTLTYSPTFSVTDIEVSKADGRTAVAINAGAASVAWHDRFVRVVVSESGSYGWESLGYLYATPVAGQGLAGGQTTPGQTAPGQTTPGQTTPGTTAGQAVGLTGAPASGLKSFPFGSSNSTVALLVRASRTVSLSMSGGYSLSGNLTGDPRYSTIYPEQHGPLGSASVIYVPSALDTLATTVSAQQTSTPDGQCTSGPPGQLCKQDTPILLAQETARRRLSSTATVSASLGVSATIYQLSTGQAWGILPVGGVTYTDRFGAGPKDLRDPLEASGVRLSADVVPTVNVFTGLPSNRVQLGATLVTHLSPRATLSYVAGLVQTVSFPQPDPSPLTVLNGGMELRVRLTRLISASAGLQGLWQQQQNVGGIPGAPGTTATSGSEVGYLALTVRAARVKL
jgi:hypothetical protein